MTEAREKKRQKVLRPGIVLPAYGYLGSLGFVIAGLTLAASPGPHSHSIDARWFVGQVGVTVAWVLYKIGSQRFVLGADVMRVVSFLQVRYVRRGGVQEVDLRDSTYALVIALTDRSLIEPLMFLTWSRAPGNAMSRITIRDRIMEWNAIPDTEDGAGPLTWRKFRLNLVLLLGLSAVVAVEAITLTAVNVW